MSLTYTETLEQYNALRKTIDLIQKNQEALKAFYDKANPKSLIFVGCGSSYMLSCAMRTTASTLTDVPVYAFAGGDLWLNLDLYKARMKDSLVISFSRSGKTSEVVNVHKAIHDLNCNARFLSVTCVEDTPMEAASDYTVCIPWAFDASVCQTRSVTNLYAAGAMILEAFVGGKRIMNGFAKMAEMGNAYLGQIEPQLRQIAQLDWDHAVVLADGPFDGVAEEAALTYKEISQLPSNYYHLLDSRHGPMVVFDSRTVVVALLHSPLKPQEAALVGDVLQKGAHVLTVSAQPVEIENTVNFPLGADVEEYVLGLLLLNVCQLLSYFKSSVVGCEPDAPDGLTAWIELK